MKPLEELLEIAKSAKEKADKAAEGPWFVDGLGNDKAELKNNADLRIYVVNPRGFKSLQSTDLTASFIASARTDVPMLADAVIDLITQLKDAQAEIKSLNTFNTQFTRADKISWGGLYIQVSQLEQRLAECETALKKALEFGEYADWAIDADKNLQQLDIDSRAYLTKWGVK